MRNHKVLVLFLFVFSMIFIAACSPDAEKCAEYKTQAAKNACLINLAVEKKDISVCKEAPQNCLRIVWMEFPDESVCMNIENPQARDQCYRHVAAVKKNAGICRQVLEQGQKDSCISLLSRVNRNSSLCIGISNVSLRDECISIYSNQKTIDMCNLIQDVRLKAGCATEIAAREKNYGICDPMAEQFKDICYLSVATFYGDIEKCRLILSPEIRDSCISLSARDEEDLKLCDDFNEELKEQCIGKVGGASGKIELCSTIEAVKLRDYCLRDAARVLKEGRHCESISNSTIKDACYKGIGR